MSVFRHAGSVDAADWNGDGRLDLMVSTENPSDQPIGEILHLFDRAFLDDDLCQKLCPANWNRATRRAERWTERR